MQASGIGEKIGRAKSCTFQCRMYRQYSVEDDNVGIRFLNGP